MIIGHHFRLFNKIRIKTGNKIIWKKDYLSGRKYSNRFYKNLRLINLSSPDDPKVPLELSRFHYSLPLAQAYVLTRNEKYADGFISLFLDWCRKNPWKFGINWTCAMEVAIRACNWIVSFEILKESRSIRNISLKLLKTVFQQHLDFILYNLEYSEEGTTNHYIADLLGLIFICSSFPGLKRAKEAMDFAFFELEKEVHKQFYEDGGNWESSTTYHRFVLEMIFFADLIADRMGCPFSDTFRQRIKKSCLLLNSLANVDGRIPQIGDNDSGRILPFKEREDTDVRHIGALFGLLYKDPDLIDTRWGYPEEAIWIFGEKGYEIYLSLKEQKKRVNQTSAAFKNSGWFVMRANDIQMVISAAPNGQNGHGGHCHNDKLSFTLSLGKDEVITDPGTFVYSGDIQLRRKFRSASSHNTIMIDNEEQNRFINKAVFWVQPDAKIRLLEWKSDGRYDIFCAEHAGYERLMGKVVHRRSIAFDKSKLSWIILDEVYEKVPTGKKRNMLFSFHSESVEVNYHNSSMVAEIFNGLERLLSLEPSNFEDARRGFCIKLASWKLYGLINPSSIFDFVIEDCLISDSYLSKFNGRVIRCHATVHLPLKIVTYLWLEKKG